MFLTCSHFYAISEPARVDPINRRGRESAEGFGPEAGGRREVIRERLSSRHCEELKNADGPPDGVARRKPAAPKGPRLPDTGGRASHLKAFQAKARDLTALRKVWTLSSNDESSKKSSSPGCRWQGRAGRYFPRSRRTLPHAFSSSRRKPGPRGDPPRLLVPRSRLRRDDGALAIPRHASRSSTSPDSGRSPSAGS